MIGLDNLVIWTGLALIYGTVFAVLYWAARIVVLYATGVLVWLGVIE